MSRREMTSVIETVWAMKAEQEGFAAREAAVSEMGDGYCYRLRWFPVEKPEGVRLAGDRSAGRFQGGLAARRFIDHLCGFVQYWPERPVELSEIRGLPAGRRSQLGFAPSE